MREHYKLYPLDQDGRIMKPVWIEAANDAEAIARAREIGHPYASELWLNARKVSTIDRGDG